mgnify:CR=1 FL=1
MMHAQTTITAAVPLTASPEDLMRGAFEAEELIRFATEQITALQERRDKILELLTARGIHQAGNYEIMQRVRTTRKINVGLFRQAFPDAYNKICDDEQRRLIASVGKTIRIQDAEKLIGSDRLAPVCDLQTAVSFTVCQRFIE